MIPPIWYLVATTLLPVAYVFAREPDYGVGFELTLDYGVASIQFTNGSYVEVAKIEGNPTYKQRMRTADVQKDSDIQTTVGWPSFRNYLPPWLGGHTHEPLSGMLKSLKIATESYLEASVSTGEITVPFPMSNTFYDTLRSIAKSVSISIPEFGASPAGIIAAVYVYDIGPGECDNFPDPSDPEQAFLTVEYTRSVLTALLVVEGCGVYAYLRVLHETQLGSQESPQDRRAKLTTALENIIKMPIKSYDGTILKSLSNLVLLGESSQDQLLHDVLKDVLSKQQQSGINTAVVNKHKEPVNPVFAASVGAALRHLYRSGLIHDEI